MIWILLVMLIKYIYLVNKPYYKIRSLRLFSQQPHLVGNQRDPSIILVTGSCGIP